MSNVLALAAVLEERALLNNASQQLRQRCVEHPRRRLSGEKKQRMIVRAVLEARGLRLSNNASNTSVSDYLARRGKK